MVDHPQKSLLPDHIKNLNPYIAGKTIEEVKSCYHPDRISKLASNENRLGCSSTVKPAIKKALPHTQNYPDPIARKLRAAIAKENNVQPEQVLIAGGSESVIAILCRTFFCTGEHAISADATFVGFFVQMGVCDTPIKKIPLTDQYKFDLDGILASITDNTKMIYIANPNNPTGTYITDHEFETFMTQVPNDIIVVMDEAYLEYADHVDDYPQTLNYNFPNIISLRTFSKAYGLAGFRIGYAIADEKYIAPMMKAKLTFEPTTLAQAAALAALKDQSFVKRSRQMVAKNKKRLYHFLDKHDIKYVPSIANAVLMLLPSEEKAAYFTQQMLEQGVILRQAGAFGIPNGIRITIGTDDEMEHFEQSFDKIDIG